MLPRQSEATDAEPARLWPADRVERWPFERLIPYANNPRSHSEADLDKIAAPSGNGDGRLPVLAE
jgi:hypothetical protein